MISCPSFVCFRSKTKISIRQSVKFSYRGIFSKLLGVFLLAILVLNPELVNASITVSDCQAKFATGGTVSVITQGGRTYCVHSFTSVGNGSFSVNRSGGLNVEYLVVGGGGAARNSNGFWGGGGGGGGGVLTGVVSINSGVTQVVVGAGGINVDVTISGDFPSTLDGGSSSFGTVTATGGGGERRDGGSGGGHPGWPGSSGRLSIDPGGNGITGQGTNGGRGWITVPDDHPQRAGGGGGGAGSSGANAGALQGGNGGVGISSSITGNILYYGGGGGGGVVGRTSTFPGSAGDVPAQNIGLGGQGGGGAGGFNNVDEATRNGVDGIANTGGGGGGAAGGSNTAFGGKGGSGIVVVRYDVSQLSAPTDLSAISGNEQITINFTAPESIDQFPITDYEYQLDGGSWTSVGTINSPFIITGLNNGQHYEIRLRAVNGGGAGVESGPITATPRTVPAAPTGLVATPGNTEVTIAFNAGFDGGAVITNYEYSTDGGTTWTARDPASTDSPVTITGLTNGQSYDIRLRAVNPAGSGEASESVSVTPVNVPESLLFVTFTASIVAGTVSELITVELRGSDNELAQAEAGGRTVKLSAEPSNITFRNEAGVDVTSVTIPENESSVSFRATGTVADSYALTANAGDGGFTLTQPFTITAGAASATTSTVTAAPTSLEANDMAISTLTVQLKDAAGNNLTSSGGVVTFAALDANQGSIGAVTDNADGTYTATYTAGTLAGPVTVTPSVDGVSFTNTVSITLTINPDLQEDLDAALATAGGLTEDTYTVDSWKALDDALSLPETTNAEVVDKTNAINAAIDALVTKTAADALADAKSDADALTVGDYTPASWTVLQNALGLPEATPADIADKTSAINSAIDGLVFAGQADLDAAVGQTTGLNQNDYTPESWATLTTALSLPETTNAEVVDKTNAINAAIDALVTKTAADALADAKSDADALTVGDYTAESWIVLQNALDLPESTPAEIAIKTSAINSAIAGLVFAGQEALDAAIAQANGLIQNDYAAESWATLTAALNLPATTNAKVVAKTNAINAAIDALVSVEPLQAPVITSIEPKQGQLKVYFTSPVASYSPIKGYEYQLDEGAWIAANQSTSPLLITDLPDGTYVLRLRGVNAQGPGIPSFKVKATVGASDVSPPETIAEIVGSSVATVSTAESEERIEISVILRDSLGNVISRGGHTVIASTDLGVLTQNPSGQTIPMRDNDDGSYTVWLTSTEPGRANVTISVNGEDAGSLNVRFNRDALGVVITGPETLSGMEPFEVQVRFDRPVRDFELEDISLINGTALSLSGGGNDFTAVIRPNQARESVYISVPANVAIATDDSDDANQSSNVFEVQVDNERIVDLTRKAISGFMLDRANNLASNQPELARLLDTDGSGCGYWNASGSERRAVGNACAKFNINSWIDATGSWSRKQSSYSLVSVGSHTWLTSDLLVGGMMQFDYADDRRNFTRGTGWLIGPYFAAKHPSQPLRFEGRLLYGQSRNEISPLGTYRDRFDTERGLVQFAARGDIHREHITISPLLDLTYVTDRQLSYNDSLGNLIPSQRIHLLQSSAGLVFKIDVPMEQGHLGIDGGLSGIYSATSGSFNDFARQRARATLGLDYGRSTNSAFRIEGFVDGLGTDKQSHGGRLGFTWKFD